MTAEATRAGRLWLSWRICPADSPMVARWSIAADGLPRLVMGWGARRRAIATLWVNPEHGPRDNRPARVAFATGPLAELGVVWRVTWHTWDARGTGGENASDGDLITAIESALMAALRQGYIASLRALEVQHAMAAADNLSAEWRRSHGLNTPRWSYSG